MVEEKTWASDTKFRDPKEYQGHPLFDVYQAEVQGEDGKVSKVWKKKGVKIPESKRARFKVKLKDSWFFNHVPKATTFEKPSKENGNMSGLRALQIYAVRAAKDAVLEVIERSKGKVSRATVFVGNTLPEEEKAAREAEKAKIKQERDDEKKKRQDKREKKRNEIAARKEKARLAREAKLKAELAKVQSVKEKA